MRAGDAMQRIGPTYGRPQANESNAMSSAKSPREVPALGCEICAAPMEYRGNLPATLTKKAARLFRCSQCDYFSVLPIGPPSLSAG